jgi:aryl-alcohol dehydrogenase-like predicted oxidoreductase
MTIYLYYLVWNWTPEAEKDAKHAFDKAFDLGISFYNTGKKKAKPNRFTHD